MIYFVVELVVVFVFYIMGNLLGIYYIVGFMYFIFFLMGVGGLIYSLVDFSIVYFLVSILSKYVDILIFIEVK